MQYDYGAETGRNACITKTTGAEETKGADEEQNRVVKRKRIIVDFCMMTRAGTKTRSLIPCDCET